jgi:hypothetical protein
MQVGWLKKHVCGCEWMIAGKGCHTLAFVRWLFPFLFLSLCIKFHWYDALLGLLVTVWVNVLFANGASFCLYGYLVIIVWIYLQKE